ncbi:hypothetical protein GH714_014035 [Hevea brasiliensis]|uniref:CCHC-type domain-containing protein n=1 Tax=Hevea brasiliensis TaxID=3981 RepID=A0A6A6KP76_HEVBR|nr:hypothetical protein GH714_014035 [Hevea brasiliensis]
MEDTYGVLSVGEYSWEVVRGADVTMPETNAENAEAIKQWKQRNAKAEFVLKRFISLALFDHIIHCKLACEIWQTLDRLFNKKDMAHFKKPEFESLLSFKESLAKQMARVSIKSKEGSAPLAKRKNFVKRSERRKDLDKNKGDVTSSKKSIKCYRYGEIGHIRKNCHFNLKEIVTWLILRKVKLISRMDKEAIIMKKSGEIALWLK